jgi:hypothetical protein
MEISSPANQSLLQKRDFIPSPLFHLLLAADFLLWFWQGLRLDKSTIQIIYYSIIYATNLSWLIDYDLPGVQKIHGDD